MAETYRGLTIKIGGDTSTLQKALKAANGAIGETQSQLRTIGQALKFDPGSMNAINIQLGLIDDKAEDTAYKMSMLRQTYEQMGEKVIDGTPLTELADNTHNAALRARVLREEYNELTKTLAEQYTELTKLSKEYGSGMKVNAESLTTGWDKLEAEYNNITAAIEAMKKAEAEKPEGSEERIADLENTKVALDALMDVVKGAKKGFQEAFSGLEDANEVVQVQQLRNEMTKTEAQAKSLAKQMVELGKDAALKESIGESLNDIRSMGTALEAAIQRFQVLDTAAKLDPTNVEKANARTQALAQVTDLAARKEQLLQEAMAKLDASKTDALVAKYGSLQNAVAQTTKNAEDLAQKVVRLESELSQAAADDGFKSMIPDILDTDKSVDGLTDSVTQLREQLRGARSDLDNAMGEVNTANACAQVQQLGDEVERTHNTVAEAGRGMTNTFDEAAFQQVVGRISQLAQQAGRAMVESANTIDAAYRDMRKTVEGTEQEFENLRESAIRFSQTNFTSADTILSIEALGGQLGIAASSLQDFGEAISSVVIATDIGAEDAALKFGQLTNVMSDLNDTTFENVADSLVRLGNTTATTESAIMEVAQRMASVANVTSMTTPELLAWSAAISSTGLRSESAATSISKTIVGIGQAVASGGDDLKQFASIAGMTSDEFEKAWAESSSDALEAFVKGLADLTDDSTAAIEALDHVGISSVRQETALLALSQTIDNLDEAMYNSVDAFNGGGDAAREAEKKSEGFSGTLAMLQNNASNLAASLGDGLIPAMRLLSGLLSVLTNFLDGLPGPLKSAVAELGLAAVATGALVAALKGLGMNGAVESIRGFVTQLLGLQAAEAAATAGATGLTAALSAIPVLGAIVAATAAVNAFAEAVGDCIEHVNLMRDATDGLRDAHEMLEKSYSETSGMTTSLDDMETAHREALQSVADFGDRMHETWSDVGTNMAMAERYAETIKGLGNSGEISAREMSTLRNAISSYNEITGASVQLIGDETSALNIQTGAIDDVTEAYKRRAEAAAYEELLAEATRKQIENELKLKETREELAELTADGVWLDETARLHELEQTESDLSKVDNELKHTIDDLAGGMTESTRAASEYATALVSAGLGTQELGEMSDEQRAKLDEIQSELASAGHSLTDYGSLNVSQLTRIIAAWNGSVPEILSAIERISSAADSASAAVDSVSKPSDDAVREFKNKQEDAYTAAKRSADDYYSSAKTERDHFYDSEKDARDKSYSNLKKTLDDAYDARKRELDSEYNAAKAASDRYLRDYKSSLDDQVTAFKAATDERIKAIDEEYDAKGKLLEQEYQGYDDDIAAQIQAIRDEQDAEDRAAKDSERREKLEELRRSVRTARTRKAREDAEKALSDYTRKIAQEDAKAARTSRISELEEQRTALREQLAERKATLKESRDSVVSSYKEEREQILATLKAANDAEYEQEKANEQAKLAARKAANDETLRMLKDSNDVQLAEAKDANDSYLKSLRERHDAELLEIKRANEDKLAEIKNQQERELAAFKKGGQDAVDAIDEVEEKEEAVAAKAEEATSRVIDSSVAATASLDDVARALSSNSDLTLSTLTGLANRLPGSVQRVFDELGLTVDNGLGDVARIMRDNGLITYDEYVRVLSGLPGSTKSIANETGLVLAAQLGLFGDDVKAASQGLVNSAKGPLDMLGSHGRTAGRELAAGVAEMGGAAGKRDVANGAASLFDAIRRQTSDAMRGGEASGYDYDVSVANGIAKGSDAPIGNTRALSEAILAQLDITEPAGILGANAATSWGNKFAEFGSGTIDGVRAWANGVVTTIMGAHQIHSPSRKFAWLAEMDLGGYERGWEAGSDSVERAVGRTADALTSALSGAGDDAMGSVLDSMRSRESELAAQAGRMARIVEDGFDPRMTVDAAYEAMARIDAGTLRRQMQIASSQSVDNSTYAPVINISIPEVVVREEADIDRLSQRIALRVQRNLNARIG